MKKEFYTYDNIRASVENGAALLFLTDFGISKYGKISFINLCDEGDEIHAGAPFGDCEAAKGVFDLISPVDGRVIEVNDAVLAKPDSLTANDFLIKTALTAEADNALSYDEYESYIKTAPARFQSPRERSVADGSLITNCANNNTEN